MFILGVGNRGITLRNKSLLDGVALIVGGNRHEANVLAFHLSRDRGGLCRTVRTRATRVGLAINISPARACANICRNCAFGGSSGLTWLGSGYLVRRIRRCSRPRGVSRTRHQNANTSHHENFSQLQKCHDQRSRQHDRSQ